MASKASCSGCAGVQGVLIPEKTGFRQTAPCAIAAGEVKRVAHFFSPAEPQDQRDSVRVNTPPQLDTCW